jgi:hypothetical protein
VGYQRFVKSLIFAPTLGRIMSSRKFRTKTCSPSFTKTPKENMPSCPNEGRTRPLGVAIDAREDFGVVSGKGLHIAKFHAGKTSL